MKNPLDVLRMKEQELQQVRKEVEALRITLKLLGEETAADAKVDLRQTAETRQGNSAYKA